ncbi:MAG: hypothetical protein HKM93_03195 [Desulfobacteraceae bacterium]|nr:hypothetical protein [Desulfobacteraceae bacterium]
MNIIDLKNFSIPATGTGRGITNIDFSLSEHDVYAVETRYPEDGRIFLRALATLVTPIQGEYRYKDEPLDFSDYRNLLPYKKKIGYIAPDAVLISNRSVLQNLLLLRYYHEDNLSITIDDRLASLCRKLDLYDKLHLRPGQLNPLDVQIAVCLREISKSPEVILLNRPEDFIGRMKADRLKHLFQAVIDQGTPVVFLSYDKNFIDRYANKIAVIEEETLTIVSVN